MKEHNWEKKEFTGPDLSGKLWICHDCGCSGGPVFLDSPEQPRWQPFVAGTPIINIPTDCDHARKHIDEFVEKYPIWKEYVDKARAV